MRLFSLGQALMREASMRQNSPAHRRREFERVLGMACWLFMAPGSFRSGVVYFHWGVGTIQGAFGGFQAPVVYFHGCFAYC